MTTAAFRRHLEHTRVCAPQGPSAVPSWPWHRILRTLPVGRRAHLAYVRSLQAEPSVIVHDGRSHLVWDVDLERMYVRFALGLTSNPRLAYRRFATLFADMAARRLVARGEYLRAMPLATLVGIALSVEDYEQDTQADDLPAWFRNGMRMTSHWCAEHAFLHEVSHLIFAEKPDDVRRQLATLAPEILRPAGVFHGPLEAQLLELACDHKALDLSLGLHAERWDTQHLALWHMAMAFQAAFHGAREDLNLYAAPPSYVKWSDIRELQPAGDMRQRFDLRWALLASLRAVWGGDWPGDCQAAFEAATAHWHRTAHPALSGVVWHVLAGEGFSRMFEEAPDFQRNATARAHCLWLLGYSDAAADEHARQGGAVLKDLTDQCFAYLHGLRADHRYRPVVDALTE